MKIYAAAERFARLTETPWPPDKPTDDGQSIRDHLGRRIVEVGPIAALVIDAEPTWPDGHRDLVLYYADEGATETRPGVDVPYRNVKARERPPILVTQTTLTWPGREPAP